MGYRFSISHKYIFVRSSGQKRVGLGGWLETSHKVGVFEELLTTWPFVGKHTWKIEVDPPNFVQMMG